MRLLKSLLLPVRNRGNIKMFPVALRASASQSSTSVLAPLSAAEHGARPSENVCSLARAADLDPRSLQIPSLQDWREELDKSPALSLARLLMPKLDPIECLTAQDAIIHGARPFDLRVKGIDSEGQYPAPRAKQGNSGRCWILAANNVLRYPIAKRLGLCDFELSHSYLWFYDKLERANYYLRQMMETRHETLDSRLVTHLNSNPMGDGAHWHMAVDLFEKYGMVPMSIYPDTYSSADSANMNRILNTKVRGYAHTLRSNPDGDLKAQYMRDIYNTLSIILGSPPNPDHPIKWEYQVRSDCRSWEGTPRDFYREFGRMEGTDPEESICLTNDPRYEYGRLYTVDRLGNVWGGRQAKHVNVPIESMEDAVITAIRADHPIMFACDVSKSCSRSLGILDPKLFETPTYGFAVNLSKADRIRMGETRITHGMVITAVHLDQHGRPVRYQVENSWGMEAGDQGWFVMTDEWFRENVFQVMAARGLVDDRWLRVLDEGDLTVLPLWDPLCSLV